MKSTENFKNIIFQYVENMANNDASFMIKFKNENKNIDDCITYILNKVKKSECNGFEDDVIFGMAIHYYDEDNVEVGEKIEAEIFVNKKVPLTDEEIKMAKLKALDLLILEEKQKLTKKREVKKEQIQPNQLSLFD